MLSSTVHSTGGVAAVGVKAALHCESGWTKLIVARLQRATQEDCPSYDNFPLCSQPMLYRQCAAMRTSLSNTDHWFEYTRENYHQGQSS